MQTQDHSTNHWRRRGSRITDSYQVASSGALAQSKNRWMPRINAPMKYIGMKAKIEQRRVNKISSVSPIRRVFCKRACASGRNFLRSHGVGLSSLLLQEPWMASSKESSLLPSWEYLCDVLGLYRPVFHAMHDTLQTQTNVITPKHVLHSHDPFKNHPMFEHPFHQGWSTTQPPMDIHCKSGDSPSPHELVDQRSNVLDFAAFTLRPT